MTFDATGLNFGKEIDPKSWSCLCSEKFLSDWAKIESCLTISDMLVSCSIWHVRIDRSAAWIGRCVDRIDRCAVNFVRTDSNAVNFDSMGSWIDRFAVNIGRCVDSSAVVTDRSDWMYLLMLPPVEPVDELPAAGLTGVGISHPLARHHRL